LQIFFRSYRSIDFARHKFITYLQVKHMCQFEDFTRARGTSTTVAGRLQCVVLLETLSQSPLWPSINPSIFLSRLKTHLFQNIRSSHFAGPSWTWTWTRPALVLLIVSMFQFCLHIIFSVYVRSTVTVSVSVG